eukprot:6725584-Prymnesium_polylepis.1
MVSTAWAHAVRCAPRPWLHARASRACDYSAMCARGCKSTKPLRFPLVLAVPTLDERARQ